MVEVRFSCFSLRNTTKGKLAATESHQRRIDSGDFTNASATAQVAFGGVEVNKDETGPGRGGEGGEGRARGGEMLIGLESSA